MRACLAGALPGGFQVPDARCEPGRMLRAGGSRAAGACGPRRGAGRRSGRSVRGRSTGAASGGSCGSCGRVACGLPGAGCGGRRAPRARSACTRVRTCARRCRMRRPGKGWPAWPIAIPGRRPRAGCGPAVSPVFTRSAVLPIGRRSSICSPVRVAGWMVAGHVRAGLVLDALDMALAARRPGIGEAVMPAGRGTRCASRAFRGRCPASGVIPRPAARGPAMAMRRRDHLTPRSGKSSSAGVYGEMPTRPGPRYPAASGGTATASGYSVAWGN